MVTDAFFQIWLWYKHSFCIWSLQKFACCFKLVLRALLRSCQQNSHRQHIPIWKRFHESTLETTSTGTGSFDNLKCSAFSFFFSDQNYQSNMAYSIGHSDVACLPKTSTNCFRTVDLRPHYLPHLNRIFTSHNFMEFSKQYTFQILTLHATSSFISEMVRRWQPCCSIVKPWSYESTQNSALFHLKLVKSTQHLYDTFFNWLNVSVSESVVLLLQNCTIFGVSFLHSKSRFDKIRFYSTNAMDYGIFVYSLPKTPADFVLNT
mgnify:FL=1